MKYIIGMVLLFVLSVSGVFAGEEGYEKPVYSPVDDYNFNMKVEVENGKVYAKWVPFGGSEKLKWYKFVYSKTNKYPTYPENSAEYVGNKASITSHSQYLERGTYYVRLCAISHSNERFCGSVTKINVGDKKKYVKKIEAKKINHTTTKKVINSSETLSEEKKKRIRKIAGNFLKKLEKKKYSNEKNLAIIKKMNVKLEELKSKPRLKQIVTYLIIVLNEYKEKYEDDFGILEDILNEY